MLVSYSGHIAIIFLNFSLGGWFRKAYCMHNYKTNFLMWSLFLDSVTYDIKASTHANGASSQAAHLIFTFPPSSAMANGVLLHHHSSNEMFPSVNCFTVIDDCSETIVSPSNDDNKAYWANE